MITPNASNWVYRGESPDPTSLDCSPPTYIWSQPLVRSRFKSTQRQCGEWLRLTPLRFRSQAISVRSRRNTDASIRPATDGR
jgi:hypothetical protein